MLWGSWAALFEAGPYHAQHILFAPILNFLNSGDKAGLPSLALGSWVVKLREEEPAGSANGLVAVYNSNISAHPK
jgi:hypothetical protein